MLSTFGWADMHRSVGSGGNGFDLPRPCPHSRCKATSLSLIETSLPSPLKRPPQDWRACPVPVQSGNVHECQRDVVAARHRCAEGLDVLRPEGRDAGAIEAAAPETLV